VTKVVINAFAVTRFYDTLSMEVQFEF